MGRAHASHRPQFCLLRGFHRRTETDRKAEDVPVKEVGGALQFGSPEPLVTNWSSPQFFFDVSPDGKKILLDRISQQVSQSVTVVTNFAAGLSKEVTGTIILRVEPAFTCTGKCRTICLPDSVGFPFLWLPVCDEFAVGV